MNEITEELVRRIAATIPENTDKCSHNGPRIIDEGPSKELAALLADPVAFRREAKKIIKLLSPMTDRMPGESNTPESNSQPDASSSGAVPPAESALSHWRIETLCAVIYARRDWHELTSFERELTERLYAAGELVRDNPASGFVGKLPIGDHQNTQNDS